MIADIKADFERRAAQLRSEAAAKREGVATLKLDLRVIAETPSDQENPCPYQGKDWQFSVSEGDLIPLGRSKGKKYVNSGISLYKDPRVSTNHGVVSIYNSILE